jgi:hypothetical protein
VIYEDPILDLLNTSELKLLIVDTRIIEAIQNVTSIWRPTLYLAELTVYVSST